MVRRCVRVMARVAGTMALAGAAAIPVSVATAAGHPALGSRTLRPGMSGPDVKTLQSDLTRAGFKTPADGVFGPATTRSVKGFEQRFHLRVNGIVTGAFVKELRLVLFPGASANSVALGERTLRQGMAGTDVSALQQALSTTGYPTKVDGSFGSSTTASVKYFQQDNGMQANGVVNYSEAQVLTQLVAIVRVGGKYSGLGNGQAPAPVKPPPPPPPTPTGTTATINSNGTATAPAGAPAQVAQVIAAANQIIDKPYVWGGGHGSWISSGYDCSGAVSYALHGGGLLSSPEDSTSLESYGQSGPGKWITIYADASHAFMVVAGRAFDTADYGGPNIPAGSGPRWRYNPTGNLADGGDFIVRHPAGL